MDVQHFVKKLLGISVLGLCGSTCSSPAAAAIAWGTPDGSANDGRIVFDKFGVKNPQYTFDDVAQQGSLTVSFGTHFVGQSPGTPYNSLSDHSPTGPLALADGAADVVTQFDLANRGTPVLGGYFGKARFTTPIAILFSDPVTQVGFVLGFLDEEPPSTVIEAFDATGSSLGVLDSLAPGNSLLTIVDDGGRISGVSIYIPGNGNDQEGFGIHDVTFTRGGGVVPEPAALCVWSVLGLTAFCAALCSLRSTEAGLPRS